MGDGYLVSEGNRVVIYLDAKKINGLGLSQDLPYAHTTIEFKVSLDENLGKKNCAGSGWA